MIPFVVAMANGMVVQKLQNSIHSFIEAGDVSRLFRWPLCGASTEGPGLDSAAMWRDVQLPKRSVSPSGLRVSLVGIFSINLTNVNCIAYHQSSANKQ